MMSGTQDEGHLQQRDDPDRHDADDDEEPPAPLGEPIEPARDDPGRRSGVRHPVQGGDDRRHDLAQDDRDRHGQDETESPGDHEAAR